MHGSSLSMSTPLSMRSFWSTSEGLESHPDPRFQDDLQQTRPAAWPG